MDLEYKIKTARVGLTSTKVGLKTLGGWSGFCCTASAPAGFGFETKNLIGKSGIVAAVHSLDFDKKVYGVVQNRVLIFDKKAHAGVWNTAGFGFKTNKIN
jgi:hypothetical protein